MEVKKEAKVVAVAEASLEVSALEAKKVEKAAAMVEAMVPQPKHRPTAPLKMTNLHMEEGVEGASLEASSCLTSDPS